MSKVIDLKGQRFGRLVVVGRATAKSHLRWECLCDCGNKTVAFGLNLKRGHTQSCGCKAVEPRFKGEDLSGKRFGRLVVLKKARGGWDCLCDCGERRVNSSHALACGASKSCGCLSLEGLLERITKHGMHGTRIYTIWDGIIQRCTNPKNRSFSRYGGRGITVCPEWLTFEGFRDDMLESYLSHVDEFGVANTSIERKNNSKGYSLENCTWATRREQQNNMGSNVTLRHPDGRKMSLSQWAVGLQVSRNTLDHRRKNGWSDREILTTPINTAMRRV